MVDEKQEDWDRYLSAVLFAYRTSVQASTKYSPFYLMYHRQAKLPIDIKMQGETKVEFEKEGENNIRITEEQVEKMLTIQSQAFENIHRAQHRQKKYYDAKHASKFSTWSFIQCQFTQVLSFISGAVSEFKPGVLVLVKNSKKESKKVISRRRTGMDLFGSKKILAKEHILSL